VGIIEKQATRNAIYSYLGAGLGFVTVMWMAHMLKPSENGVIRILVSYAALFAQFANLGFTSVTSRFFPFFRNKDRGHHGFLFYAIIVTIIGFVLCWIIFLFFQPYLIKNNELKSPLFSTYLFYLMPLTLFTVFFNIFDSYLRAGYSSVAGSFTREFLQRIFILFVLVMYFLELIDFRAFMLLYIFFTCLSTLILLFHIILKGEWHIKPVKAFVNKELRNEMIRLGLYSILAGSAGAIIVYIDAIMVNWLLDEERTGVYSIAFYFGTIILIPARSLYRITSSVVAENFKTNKIAEIHTLYRQSCNSQLAIGTLLFIGIVANIDNIMALLPEDYSSGKIVILIISAGYLIEMATGINQVIIVNSEHYRFDAYFVFSVVGIAVLLNYIFITKYGITGSAIATAITVLISNSLRYTLLYVKYGMQPYNSNTIKLIAIAIISFLPGYFLPVIPNLFLDIAIRSSLIGTVFVVLILKLEAAPELNNKIRKNLKNIGIKL
jgi:O-antigen/teichoic acid export membrane protein